MKILVVIYSLDRGGAERVVSVLSQEWAKQHEVKIALFDASNRAYPYGGDLIDLGLYSRGGWFGKAIQSLRRVTRLARCFRDERPDQIITFMESANFPAILAAGLVGQLRRLWVSVHNDPRRFSKAYRLLIPYFYRLPNRVVAVSKGVAGALAGMGVPRAKLAAIPNPAPADAPSIDDQLAKPLQAPTRYLLGVGRLHGQKGFDRLIEAFAGLGDDTLHLVILGEGKDREALESKAQALGVANRLYLPGAVSDVWPWYRHATCFVLSSRYEGWGNVLIEAMSQGAPVVSFDCQYGPAEIVRHGHNGFLVTEGDVGALTGFIDKVINDNSLRLTLARNAQDSVANFSAQRLAGQWLNGTEPQSVFSDRQNND